jgi:pimeloyl-ACP methyl ester carboxylesterase
LIRVLDTPVRYVEAGSQNPGTPLLLIHGYNGSSDLFLYYLMPALGMQRRVLAFDLPGNGWSAKLAAYSLRTYADFVAAFLDALGIAEADLLGHSMGGQVAIAAILANPHRFRRLVLVDSAGLRRPLSGLLSPLRMVTDSSMRLTSLYPLYLRVGLKARAAHQGMKMLQQECIGSSLEHVTHPTLLIWGERDRVIPVSHGVAMAKQMPNARLEILPGCGHIPFHEKPQEFSKSVLTFLTRESGA